MTLASPSQSVPGTVITAAKINDPVNNIAAVVNGNIDDTNISGVSGSKLTAGTVTAPKLNFGGSGSGIWWEEIGRTVLTVAGDSITVSGLPSRKYIQLQVSTSAISGTTNNFLRFNNDSGSTYAERYMEDGTSAILTSQTAILLAGATLASDAYIEAYILNVASKEKQVVFQGARFPTGAANAPSGSKSATGKWTNTSAVISRIDVVNTGTGDFAIGSEVVVLGHD